MKPIDPFTDRPQRDDRGRFLPGNRGGPGNPHAAKVARLRSALLEAVTEADMRDVIRKMVELAKSGDVAAAKELLDRCLGRPVEADLLDRLDELETAIMGAHR